MIGIGIVGCGGHGHSLLRRLVKIDGAELVATYDADPNSSARVAEEFGGKSCPNYKELLQTPGLDGVIVSTPGYLHREYVVKAAEAGIHVFCEKPLALTLEDCDLMIDACDSSGVNLMTGQVLRLLPIFKESARIVKDEIGSPRSMAIMRVGSWKFTSGWRCRRDLCGGILLEVNVHELDYMRHILGEPKEVFARGGRYVLDGVDFMDTIFASYRFENGSIGTLNAAVSSTMGRYRGEVFCREGTLFYDNSHKKIIYKKDGGEEKILEGDQIPSNDGVLEELKDFVESIRDDRNPSITGEDGRKAVEMALATRRSALEGEPVSIGEMGNETQE